MAKLRENKPPLKSPTGEDRKEIKNQLCAFKLMMWELELNIETFPGIPKELLYIILGLNSIYTGVIGLLLNSWVTLVDWMTFL